MRTSPRNRGEVRVDCETQEAMAGESGLRSPGGQCQRLLRVLAAQGREQAQQTGDQQANQRRGAAGHIRAIHAEFKQEYGWPKMWKQLLAQSVRVGKERVRKLMQRHGIKARGKRKFVVTTD